MNCCGCCSPAGPSPSPSPSSSSRSCICSSGVTIMNDELKAAAISGDSDKMKRMARDHGPAVLLATTPDGNTCLHIASEHNKDVFCKEVLAINGSLLAAVNVDGETPLLTAVRKGHFRLASLLLRWCRFLRLSGAVLTRDEDGRNNALHHVLLAINGNLSTDLTRARRNLVLQLIEAEPDLARAVNKDNESPMFIAIKRGYTDVFEKLMKTPGSSNKGGCYGPNARRATETTDTTTSGPATTDKSLEELVKAAVEGSVNGTNRVVLRQRTTPVGNNCLHIAAMHGHRCCDCEAVVHCLPCIQDRKKFCEDVVWGGHSSLLAEVNDDGETPLLVAVTSGNKPLASYFLELIRNDYLSNNNEDYRRRVTEALTKKDKHGCNVLHHAIRNGHQKLALELIQVAVELREAPALSCAVNKYGESPMFIAVMRDYEKVFQELLKIVGSSTAGAGGCNVLHAAVITGNPVIAEDIIDKLPELARLENSHKETPLHLAVIRDQVGVLGKLLKDYPSLGYLVSSDNGTPLLTIAARNGHVSAAREILQHCPDAPYANLSGFTCLHEAVHKGQTDFVKFVLKSPQLRKLLNMRDGNGRTALHYSVLKCMPNILEPLLRHPDIDVTMLNNEGSQATWSSTDINIRAKSSRWDEVARLLRMADPKRANHITSLHKMVKNEVTEQSRKDAKSLTETYIRNTAVVAILMASITFLAAFTVSGWYKGGAAGSQGPPIMHKKSAFQVFLLFDTLAMCCSLSVAFICVRARWEDYEFLLHYKDVTKWVMLLAYMATVMAFATGLYTALAPRLLSLTMGIIVMACFVPGFVPLLLLWLRRWQSLKHWWFWSSWPYRTRHFLKKHWVLMSEMVPTVLMNLRCRRRLTTLAPPDDSTADDPTTLPA